MKRSIIGLIFLLLVVTLFYNRVKIRDFYVAENKEPMPVAINHKEVVELPVFEIQDELPIEYNLSVPFMVQAPSANWDLPYQEACEEASIIMLHYYLENMELDEESANKEILDLVTWQNSKFGDYKDTTVFETANIIKEYWGYTTEVIENPSIDDIKYQIAKGNPVIAPFYGKALDNPFYSGEGPLYHMMVIKGYTNDKFITNDPGTKKGKDFIYDYETIMSAMHDWNDGDVENGEARIIVVQ
jgi:uncharacterized protein YvpB